MGRCARPRPKSYRVLQGMTRQTFHQPYCMTIKFMQKISDPSLVHECARGGLALSCVGCSGRPRRVRRRRYAQSIEIHESCFTCMPHGTIANTCWSHEELFKALRFPWTRPKTGGPTSRRLPLSPFPTANAPTDTSHPSDTPGRRRCRPPPRRRHAATAKPQSNGGSLCGPRSRTCPAHRNLELRAVPMALSRRPHGSRRDRACDGSLHHDRVRIGRSTLSQGSSRG